MAEYIAKYEDSLLEKALDKLAKDAVRLVREIIQKGALSNQESEFFASLGFNAVLTRKIKKEFVDNVAYLNEKLKRCIEIEALLK
jgi:N-acetylglutamate synthase-like GNAT family acetyltransferase